MPQVWRVHCAADCIEGRAIRSPVLRMPELPEVQGDSTGRLDGAGSSADFNGQADFDSLSASND